MSVWRTAVVLVLVAVATPLLVAAVSARQVATTLPADLTYYTVTRGDVSNTVTAVGSVEAAQVANLSFTTAGRVVEVLVTANDVVVAGQPLMRLESDASQIVLDQAQLALELAELQLTQLQQPVADADIAVAESAVAAASGALASANSALRPEDLRSAELRVQQAEIALDAANRARRVAGGYSDDRQYQLLDAQIGQASFNLEIARRQLADLQRGNPQAGVAYQNLLSAQAELARVQAGPGPIQVEQARVRVEQAAAQRDRAAAQLERGTLTAPYDGVVTRTFVEVGTLVAPGLPAIELTDMMPLRLTVRIDEVDVGRVRAGMGALVALDALRGVRFQAQLTELSLVGNTTASGIVEYSARVALYAADPRVRVGMTAEAALLADTRTDVLVVPNAFVRLGELGSRATVQVLQPDGTLALRQIGLGLQGQEASEVLSGLREGDVLAANLNASRLELFGG